MALVTVLGAGASPSCRAPGQNDPFGAKIPLRSIQPARLCFGFFPLLFVFVGFFSLWFVGFHKLSTAGELRSPGQLQGQEGAGVTWGQGQVSLSPLGCGGTRVWGLGGFGVGSGYRNGRFMIY